MLRVSRQGQARIAGVWPRARFGPMKAPARRPLCRLSRPRGLERRHRPQRWPHSSRQRQIRRTEYRFPDPRSRYPPRLTSPLYTRQPEECYKVHLLAIKLNPVYHASLIAKTVPRNAGRADKDDELGRIHRSTTAARGKDVRAHTTAAER